MIEFIIQFSLSLSSFFYMLSNSQLEQAYVQLLQLECHPEFETLFSIEETMRNREERREGEREKRKRKKFFFLLHIDSTRLELLTANLFDRIVLYFLDRQFSLKTRSERTYIYMKKKEEDEAKKNQKKRRKKNSSHLSSTSRLSIRHTSF